MSDPKPVISRNIVIEYHLLGFLIIIAYLIIGLPTEILWKTLPVLTALGLCFIIAEFVFHSKRPLWAHSLSTINNQKQQFIFDLSPYLFTALVVSLIESYLFNHPVAFAEKSVFAILGGGFYIAIGIALEAEHQHIQSDPAVSSRTHILPAGVKLRYFLLLILTFDWLIFAAVYFEYIHPLHYLPSSPQHVLEIFFISIVVLSLSIYLFYLYNRNFIHVLGVQINALRCVEEGSFEVSIPVVSDDELALLAGYHNAMIDRLRDRERLYRTLEKSVGANIMQKLLNTDEETLKQGQSYSVAVLFCDLRGFTSLGESASAEEVILFLNDYFADVSCVISEYNGIINKFMGDAVLAIFGLENQGNPVEDAVNASLAIIKNNEEHFMPNEMHPETGVGIDYGLVIGGTIGSEERYEYTVIGDAVNKASRLEGLSKRLGYSIILSDDAHHQLCNKTRKHFFNLGVHKVRGRNESVVIYGSCKNSHVDPDADFDADFDD